MMRSSSIKWLWQNFPCGPSLLAKLLWGPPWCQALVQWTIFNLRLIKSLLGLNSMVEKWQWLDAWKIRTSLKFTRCRNQRCTPLWEHKRKLGEVRSDQKRNCLPIFTIRWWGSPVLVRLKSTKLYIAWNPKAGGREGGREKGKDIYGFRGQMQFVYTIFSQVHVGKGIGGNRCFAEGRRASPTWVLSTVVISPSFLFFFFFF